MSAVDVAAVDEVVVKRSTRASKLGAVIAVPVLVVLFLVPYNFPIGTQQNLVTLFTLIVLGTMWNLLAGYGGMVSIGQQAYIGIGAYGLVYIADTMGINPFLAVPLAAVVAAVISVPISFAAFRLSGGYFAIGTWVIAEVVKELTLKIDVLGAGSGISLSAFSDLEPAYRVAFVYWLSLGTVVFSVAITYLLMRSRLGLGFTSIRDDETAAASLGVRVVRSKRIVFVVSAFGTALAGGMIAANSLRVQPESVFSVQWTAAMLFIVVIGGLGTIEGPIVGAVLYYALQQELADLGAWYLIILGAIAIAVVLFLPQGIWGLLSGRGRIRLFPVGYHQQHSTPKESS